MKDSIGQFYWRLAIDGSIIATSKIYSTKEECSVDLNLLKANAASAKTLDLATTWE